MRSNQRSGGSPLRGVVRFDHWLAHRTRRNNSAASRDGGRLWRNGLAVECAVQVRAGVGIVRIDSHGFLELLDRIVQSVLPDVSDAKVVMGLGVIRLQLNGDLESAYRHVDLPFP